MKYDDHPGRPLTLVTANNIENVRDVIAKNRRMGVRAIAEVVNLDRERAWLILADELFTKQVWTKMVPKILSAEQEELRQEFFSDFCKATHSEPDLLKLQLLEIKLDYLYMNHGPG